MPLYQRKKSIAGKLTTWLALCCFSIGSILLVFFTLAYYNSLGQAKWLSIEAEIKKIEINYSQRKEAKGFGVNKVEKKVNRLSLDVSYYYNVAQRTYGNKQVFSDENYNYSKNEDDPMIHKAYQNLQGKKKVTAYYNPSAPENSYLFIIDAKKQHSHYIYWGLALLIISLCFNAIGKRFL